MNKLDYSFMKTINDSIQARKAMELKAMKMDRITKITACVVLCVALLVLATVH